MCSIFPKALFLTLICSLSPRVKSCLDVFGFHRGHPLHDCSLCFQFFFCVLVSLFLDWHCCRALWSPCCRRGSWLPSFSFFFCKMCARRHTVCALSIVTLPTYHPCPKIRNSPFHYLLMCLKYCCMYSKQSRPWSDIAFWSGSSLFAKAYLSQ